MNKNNIKICRVCKIILNEINWAKGNKKRHSNICKQCEIQRGKNWKINNPEKYKKQRRLHNDKKTLLSKKGKRYSNLNKRPKPKTCELCDNKGRLYYHHWDDTDLNKGIWTCSTCHWGAEFIDKKKVEILNKYIKLKNDIEIGDSSRRILDDLQKYAISMLNKNSHKIKRKKYSLEYNLKNMDSLRFSERLDKDVIFREDIKYNFNTGNIQYISYFEAGNYKKLLNINI